MPKRRWNRDIGRLPYELTVEEMVKIHGERTKGITFNRLEKAFKLRKANGMTAWRICKLVEGELNS
jgi:hypothetical protein